MSDPSGINWLPVAIVSRNGLAIIRAPHAAHQAESLLASQHSLARVLDQALLGVEGGGVFGVMPAPSARLMTGGHPRGGRMAFEGDSKQSLA